MEAKNNKGKELVIGGAGAFAERDQVSKEKLLLEAKKVRDSTLTI